MVVCYLSHTEGHSLWPFLLSTTSLPICEFSLEGSHRTWCSPLTCRISWRDSEQSPCWGFWPWRALYRSGWDYRVSRMDRYPHCSSVAVLQHNGNSGLTATDWFRQTLQQGNIQDTVQNLESKGKNKLQQRKMCEGRKAGVVFFSLECSRTGCKHKIYKLTPHKVEWLH